MADRYQLPHRLGFPEDIRRNFESIEGFVNHKGGLDKVVRVGAVEVVSDPTNLPPTLQAIEINGVKEQIISEGGIDLGSGAVVGTLAGSHLYGETIEAVTLIGSHIKTAADGERLEIDPTYKRIAFYDSSGALKGYIYMGAGAALCSADSNHTVNVSDSGCTINGGAQVLLGGLTVGSVASPQDLTVNGNVSGKQVHSTGSGTDSGFFFKNTAGSSWQIQAVGNDIYFSNTANGRNIKISGPAADNTTRFI